MSEARNAQLPRDPVIPDKLYFRIGEVARLLDVETHTLRFWETEFPQLKVGKGGTGQRLYRRRDVELVLEIKHLLYKEGYTIPGARQLLQSRQRRKETPAPAMIATQQKPEAQLNPEKRLERIRAGLRDLSALLSDADLQKNPKSSSQRAHSEPQRRGLHLASRSPEAPRPAVKNLEAQPTPSLFDPQES